VPNKHYTMFWDLFKWGIVTCLVIGGLGSFYWEGHVESTNDTKSSISIENDICDNIISLPVRTDCNDYDVVDNIGTTASGISSNSGCLITSRPDIWFLTVVPENGSLNIETIELEGGLSQTNMEVYTGSCENLRLIDCDSGSNDSGHARIRLRDRPSGEVIFIRVNRGTSEDGYFGILVSADCYPLTNDTPEGAIELPLSNSCDLGNTFSNLGASSFLLDSLNLLFDNSFQIDCSLNLGKKDVWFKTKLTRPGSLKLKISQKDNLTSSLKVQVFYVGICIEPLYFLTACGNQDDIIEVPDYSSESFKVRSVLIRVFHENDWEGEFSICAYNEKCNCPYSPQIAGFNSQAKWMKPSDEYSLNEDTLTVHQECFDIFRQKFFQKTDIIVRNSCEVATQLTINRVRNNLWKSSWSVEDACGNIANEDLFIKGEFDCAFLSCEEIMSEDSIFNFFSGQLFIYSDDGEIFTNGFDARLDTSFIYNLLFPDISACVTVVAFGTLVQRRRRERNLIPICKGIDTKCYAVELIEEVIDIDTTYFLEDYVLGIYDNTFPSFNPPLDLTLDCNTNLNQLEVTVQEVTDNCDNILDTFYTDNIKPPFDFSVGNLKIKRIWTVRDSFGNATQKNQFITLEAKPECLQNSDTNCIDNN